MTSLGTLTTCHNVLIVYYFSVSWFGGGTKYICKYRSNYLFPGPHFLHACRTFPCYYYCIRVRIIGVYGRPRYSRNTHHTRHWGQDRRGGVLTDELKLTSYYSPSWVKEMPAADSEVRRPAFSRFYPRLALMKKSPSESPHGGGRGSQFGALKCYTT